MKSRTPLILAGVCAVAFVLGIVQLFHLRFEQGDVYRPYSSLRADPLGAMALYESLERMPGVTVRRDFSAHNQLPESQHATYLHLAGDPDEWHWMPESEVAELEGFLLRGGRLVITCQPESTGESSGSRSRFSNDTNAPVGKPRHDRPNPPAGEPFKPRDRSERKAKQDDPFARLANLNERWGFSVDYERLPRDEDGQPQPVKAANRSALPLPSSLEWHSATLFTPISTNWQVVYARGTNAVVMERRFGAGSVAVASDSFFVSNEALLRDRHADLLAWLVGPNRLVVFDEAHLGVVEEPGVATLMRRYRLHGVVGGLALLMGLFVWKNSFSLVPPPPRASANGIVAGREAATGFVNLLRRSIPAGEILKVCHEQWEKSAAARHGLAAARVEQAKQIIAAELARTGRDRNPVAAYQQAARVLKPGAGAAKAGTEGPARTLARPEATDAPSSLPTSAQGFTNSNKPPHEH
jgi:hypothetical protein